MNGVESLPKDRIGDGEDSIANHNTKKFQFKDGSVASSTNMVVDSSPVNEVSWKDKLLGGSISNSIDDVTKIDLVFEDGDIHRSNLNSILSTNFSDRINKILIKGMELIVVVKILGADYDAALSQGHWIVFGHYLTVQPWIVDFDQSRPFSYGVLAWIRFLGLPGFLYQRKILEEIGSLIGEVFKIDIKTENRERGQFTRMTFFVDLEKPLTSQVLVNCRLQCVEFEALLEGPSSLVYLGSKQNTGQTPPTSNMGSEGAAGHGNINPTAPISFLNDIATSLHVNLTFEKHPKANVGIISNALDPKKHSAVTFQEKLAIKSISKVRSDSPIIPKGHGIENKKGIDHNREASFKSIRRHGGKFKPASNSSVSLPEAMGSMVELISGQAGIPIEKSDVTSDIVRVFNRLLRPNLVSLLETRVSGEKADLVIAKICFHNSHHVEAVEFSRGIWIGWKDTINVEVFQSYPNLF
ncbi:hypothetical protein J1N35_007036 [Gossypium stocksii]|uniref:DUF4283 domain-containing protein n=1 Tax=Gossypium stocksii TaxID=47602 RepID=A0A9D3W7S7_9ROSI|nr:hypothetical protein J1N35_007036 [Gossypium stocksii]